MIRTIDMATYGRMLDYIRFICTFNFTFNHRLEAGIFQVPQSAGNGNSFKAICISHG